MVGIFTPLLLENIQATLKAKNRLFYFKIGEGMLQEKYVWFVVGHLLVKNVM